MNFGSTLCPLECTQGVSIIWCSDLVFWSNMASFQIWPRFNRAFYIGMTYWLIGVDTRSGFKLSCINVMTWVTILIQYWVDGVYLLVKEKLQTHNRYHTGYFETTNATNNKHRCWNQAGIGCKYLSGNNLPRISLIRGKFSHTGIYFIWLLIDFNSVCCSVSRWLSLGNRYVHGFTDCLICGCSFDLWFA